MIALLLMGVLIGLAIAALVAAPTIAVFAVWVQLTDGSNPRRFEL